MEKSQTVTVRKGTRSAKVDMIWLGRGKGIIFVAEDTKSGKLVDTGKLRTKAEIIRAVKRAL